VPPRRFGRAARRHNDGIVRGGFTTCKLAATSWGIRKKFRYRGAFPALGCHGAAVTAKHAAS